MRSCGRGDIVVAMENPAYWDRLTASLAVVELRDLEAVWGFLIHAGVIEHDKRGAFDVVVNAVTGVVGGAVITGPSHASRIASQLRGLQTPRGSQPDPEAAEARPQYDEWQLSRSARRAGIAPYPNARTLESGSVDSSTWTSYVVDAPIETVVARYELAHGVGRRDAVQPSAYHFAFGTHRLAVCPVADRAAFPGGTGTVSPHEQTFLLISTSTD